MIEYIYDLICLPKNVHTHNIIVKLFQFWWKKVENKVFHTVSSWNWLQRTFLIITDFDSKQYWGGKIFFFFYASEHSA